MYVFRLIFFCGFLAALTPSLSAQPPGGGARPDPIGKLTGVVQDAATGRPIEYAAVALYRQRDSSLVSGGVTDSLGRFTLSELPAGRFRLTVDFMGYHKRTLDTIALRPGAFARDLGVIGLQDAAIQTETVEIEAEKSFIQIGVEKKIYNVDKNLMTQGGTAADVLEQIPSVNIDQDGKAALRGSGNLTILIDGKPSNMGGGRERNTALDQIPANLIERVEVITNPAARYDPDGTGGIINIVLKKDARPGFYGSGNVTAGSLNKYSAGLNLNFSKGKWITQVGGSFRYNEHYRYGDSYRKNYPRDTVFYFDQDSRGDQIGRTQNINVSTTYTPSKANSITLNAGANLNSRPRWETTYYRYLDAREALSLYSERPVAETDDGTSIEAGLNWTHTYAQPGRKLTALVSGSRFMGERSMSARQSFTLPDGEPQAIPIGQYNHTDDKNFVGVGQVDYVHPLSPQSRFETGYKLIVRQADEDTRAEYLDAASDVWNYDSTRSNHFIYTEQVHAMYGIYANKWGKWDYQLGLRLEQALTQGEQKTIDQTHHYNYFSFFPSLHLARKLTETQTLQLSYTRRINRPNFNALNPFIEYTDPLNTQSGNPYLRPEYVNALEVQYVRMAERLTLTASIYYRLTTDQMMRFRTVRPDGVALTTQANLNNNHSYGVEAIAVTRWAKWCNTTASFNLFGLYLQDNAVVVGQARQGVSWTGKLLANFNFTKKVDGQLSYNYRGPNPLAQGQMRPIQSLDVGVKVSVLRSKGNVTFNITDVFDTRQFAMLSEGAGFRQDFVRKRESRVATLGFTYFFGNFNGQQPQRRQGRERPGGGEGGGDMDMF